MDQPTFTLKQVEAILVEAFSIAPSKRKTFASRLHQLQKMGIPQGANTGRGVRVAYKPWQLAEMQFALDLLDAGVPPLLIASRFQDPAFYSVDGYGRFAEAFGRCGKGFFAHIRLNALDHLRSESVRSGVDAVYNEVSSGRDLNRVVQYASGTPGVLIDLAARLKVLKAAVSKIEPSVGEFDMFEHLPGELGDSR